jgi:hypothetical protein
MLCCSYAPLDIVHYNAAPAALAELRGQFAFPLPLDARDYELTPGLHGPLSRRGASVSYTEQ